MQVHSRDFTRNILDVTEQEDSVVWFRARVEKFTSAVPGVFPSVLGRWEERVANTKNHRKLATEVKPVSPQER